MSGTTKASMSPAVRAVALIAGPLLIAALLLVLTDRDVPASGVFVEAERGAIFTLSTYEERRDLDFAGLADKAVAVPARPPFLFYVMAPAGDTLTATPDVATVYRIVVDRESSKGILDSVRVPATVDQVNPRTIRLDPNELGWGDRASIEHYDRVIAKSSGSRATTEVILALVVPDRTHGTVRIFPLRVGPG